MTLKDFFMGRAIVVSLLLAIGFAFFAYQTYFAPKVSEDISEAIPVEAISLTSFKWLFTQDSSLNPDGNPQTNVFLEITYSDGSVRHERIDTVPSSCNELPDAEEDSAPNTSVVQCYGAGLGYLYKITKGDSAYFIQRKEFEEASPEYEPAMSEYEVIGEISLTK